jgi:hypothetical protein
MSDIKAIPKKCQECNKKTTTRQREWMCPEFHQVIEGKHIALCEHPSILTKQQLEDKIKEANDQKQTQNPNKAGKFRLTETDNHEQKTRNRRCNPSDTKFF